MGGAAAVLWAGLQLLDVHKLKTERQLILQTLFDLVKLAFAFGAGLGGLVAPVVAYRRQRVDEAGALRVPTRLHSEPFTAAIGQLGDDSPALRLGSVHAVAGLADDASTRQVRQTCGPLAEHTSQINAVGPVSRLTGALGACAAGRGGVRAGGVPVDRFD